MRVSKRLEATVTAMLMASIAACSVVGAQEVAGNQKYYRPDEIVISLERTRCFGPCPAYRLTISGDGIVKYLGSYAVGVEGERGGRIEPASVARLVNAFLENFFFERREGYDRGTEFLDFQDGRYLSFGRGAPSDGPSYILFLQLGSQKKRVILRSGYPKELGQLADMIDEVTNSRQWTARK